MALHRKLPRGRLSRIIPITIIIIFLCINNFWHRHTVQKSRSELDDIPNDIWQCFDPKNTDHPLQRRLGESVQSWIVNNPDFKYTLVSDAGADDFVRNRYRSSSRVKSTFFDLNVAVFRADLLRYMLIESEGGYYSDVDTTLYKSIKQWIPVEYRDRAKFVVGIEYDQLENSEPSHGFEDHISFAQWTFAASKGHPILTKVIDKVVNALHDLAKSKKRPLPQLKYQIAKWCV